MMYIVLIWPDDTGRSALLFSSTFDVNNYWPHTLDIFLSFILENNSFSVKSDRTMGFRNLGTT